MNQGLLFTLVAFTPISPWRRPIHAIGTNLHEAERDLHAMLNRYLQPDGGTLEGMGYWHGIGEIFPTLYALARRHGRPFCDAMGERLRRTADYALAMLSSADNGTEFLRINAAGQGHLQPSLMMAAVFAGAADHDGWRQLYPDLPWMPRRRQTGSTYWSRRTHWNALRRRRPSARAFYHFPATGPRGGAPHGGGPGHGAFPPLQWSIARGTFASG